MILKIFVRAKAGVPKTLVKRKLRLHSLYFPQNTLTLTESRGSSVFCIPSLDFVRFAIKVEMFLPETVILVLIVNNVLLRKKIPRKKR